MKEEIISYDAIWDAAMKCRLGVGWKPSTKHFVVNAVTEVLRINTKLENNTWMNGQPRPIKIMYPKKRDGLSIGFNDRVYQRSINDNVLYPSVVNSFIIDNCACQKGKGIDFARKRLKKHLWNFYSRYGIDGYVLKIDIKGYYPNMRHVAVKAKFSRYLSPDVYAMVCDVLDTQYAGDVGYNPGSQMVQIAGISLLDDLDHYCKERLHVKHYLRYMDDIIIFAHTLEESNMILGEIQKELARIGFEVHSKKTQITPLSKGFTYLGFDYRITFTGKIIMTLNSANIKHERKKLKRLVRKAKAGEITREKADECFSSWCANASKGNSYKLLQRMKGYYNSLWRDYESSTIRHND